jgi:hypothetical protein
VTRIRVALVPIGTFVIFAPFCSNSPSAQICTEHRPITRAGRHLRDDVLDVEGLRMLYWIEAATHSKKQHDASEPRGDQEPRVTTDGSEP